MGFCRWRALRFGNQSHPDERAFLPLAFLHSKGTQFESHRTGQDPNWCWLCFTLGLFTSTSNRVSAPFTEQSNSVPSPKMCCTKTVAGYLSPSALPLSNKLRAAPGVALTQSHASVPPSLVVTGKTRPIMPSVGLSSRGVTTTADEKQIKKEISRTGEW